MHLYYLYDLQMGRQAFVPLDKYGAGPLDCFELNASADAKYRRLAIYRNEKCKAESCRQLATALLAHDDQLMTDH